jgi:hypothetical protein
MKLHNSIYRLVDRSEKHGEDLCFGFVPDLQRIAATNA